MAKWTFGDQEYRFEYADQIQPEDWGLDEENNRIIQIIKPDFKLRIFDLNVFKYIENRMIKVERSIKDYPRNLYVGSRADFKVPDGLFPDMHAGNKPEAWGIFENGSHEFTEEFYDWLKGEFLNEEHWWSNDTCNLTELEREIRETPKMFS